MGEDPEQLERQIEATRAKLGQDIDALEEKVNPKKVAHRSVESAKEKVADVRDKVVGKATEAKEKAAEAKAKMPSGQNGAAGENGVGQKAADLAGTVKEKAGPLVGTARQKAQPLVDKAAPAAQQVKEKAAIRAGLDPRDRGHQAGRDGRSPARPGRRCRTRPGATPRWSAGWRSCSVSCSVAEARNARDARSRAFASAQAEPGDQPVEHVPEPSPDLFVRVGEVLGVPHDPVRVRAPAGGDRARHVRHDRVVEQRGAGPVRLRSRGHWGARTRREVMWEPASTAVRDSARSRRWSRVIPARSGGTG